jgi:gamma-glutamyltranspeptidase
MLNILNHPLERYGQGRADASLLAETMKLACDRAEYLGDADLRVSWPD